MRLNSKSDHYKNYSNVNSIFHSYGLSKFNAKYMINKFYFRTSI